MVKGVALTEIGGDQFDVVINATASSLGGQELDIPDGIFSGDSIAYDMMYGPSAQTFLNKAAKKGLPKQQTVWVCWLNKRLSLFSFGAVSSPTRLKL